jgi:hypothetical protein
MEIHEKQNKTLIKNSPGGTSASWRVFAVAINKSLSPFLQCFGEESRCQLPEYLNKITLSHKLFFIFQEKKIDVRTSIC